VFFLLPDSIFDNLIDDPVVLVTTCLTHELLMIVQEFPANGCRQSARPCKVIRNKEKFRQEKLARLFCIKTARQSLRKSVKWSVAMINLLEEVKEQNCHHARTKPMSNESAKCQN